MSVVAKTAYFWRSALQGMRHAPFIHFIAVVTLAIALFVVGLARGGARMVGGLLESLDAEVQMTVYLVPGAKDAQVEEARLAVAQAAGAPPRLVTPAEALERLARELGDMGDTLRELPENPLPATLELSVPRARRTPAALRALAGEVRGLPQVASVDYGEEAVERLSAMARVLTLAGALGLGIVFVATVVIVSATLQLAIYARREEVEIQKLVGATNRFVKAPFLIEGLLQGLFGGAAALGGLCAFFHWAAPHLASAFAFLRLPGGAAAGLTALGGLELVGLGALLGLGGSFIAVGRFLKV